MLHDGIHQHQTAYGPIKYKFKAGRSDRQHLLVIFSGFRHKGTLDFGGAAIDPIKHNILWIYDEFGEPAENTYYLMQNGELNPKKAVQEFLELVCQSYGLTWGDLTFAGFSKGGSAALYHGLELGVGAVIAAVPQFAIGSYLKNNWPAVFERVRLGQDPQAEQLSLDEALPSLVEGSQGTATHVYLLSSHADPQYETELVPNLPKLRKLRFFNFLVLDSPLITQHIDVTPYNVPGLLALFQLCADKLYPSFGEVEKVVEPNEVVIKNQRQQKAGLGILEKVTAEGNRVELELATLIRGIAQSDWAGTDRSLVLKNGSEEATLVLGKKKDPSLSRRYLKDTYIDYSTALSVSPRGAMYEISSFPQGRSTMSVDLISKRDGVETSTPVKTNRPFFFHTVTHEDLLIIRDEDLQAVSIRYPLKALPVDTSAYLETKHLKMQDGRLSLHGIYAPFGAQVSNWGEISYYLVLDGEQTYAYRLGLLDKPQEIEQAGLPLSLRKAYFADLAGAGVDLAEVATGQYDAHILAVNKDTYSKSASIGTLSVTGGEPVPAAVLGSCIIRDIFNSKFSPDWKTRNTLVAAAHQSSMVSLMSTPVAIDRASLSDVDQHSAQTIVEDFEKTAIKGLLEHRPALILVDLFSDARFGIARLKDGSVITNNSWKIGASKAYKALDIEEVVTLQNNEGRYLELFKEAFGKLKRAIDGVDGYNPRVVVVSVRAADYMRDGYGNITQNQAATSMLNSAFEKLEQAAKQSYPGLEILNLHEFNTWADANHPWSSYVVHYEDSYYRALDFKVREMVNNKRQYALLDK